MERKKGAARQSGGEPAKRTLSLEMGMMACPVPQQLEEQRLPYEELEAEKWEQCRRAVNLLRVHNLITETQARGAERRLGRAIARGTGAKMRLQE